jgi:HEAT repeat protein
VDKVERLLRDLEDINAEGRENTVRQLGETGDTRALAPLVGLLANEVFDVREAAAEALGKIGDPLAVEFLKESTKDWYSGVREKAAQALGRIGNDAAVKHLITILDDGYAGIREKAVRALGNIGADIAVEPLRDALKDEHFSVREAAAEALGKMGDTGAVEHLTDTVLEDENVHVREKAVNALCKMGDAVPVKSFIDALKEKDPIAGMSAIYFLGRLGRPETVKPLIDVTREEESYVRAAAVGALTSIAKTGQVEPFIDALRDKNSNTRKLAADVLAKTGWKASNNDHLALFLVARQDWDKLVELGRDAAQPLINLLEDEDPAVVENAEEALRKIGDPGVFDLFITTFENKEEGMLQKALYLAVTQQWDKLAGVGEDAVEPLIHVLNKHKSAFYRRNAAETLGKIGDTRARKPLTEKLKDTSKIVRESAVEALVKMADTDKPGPFIKLLKDSTAHARQAAADVLNKIGWEPSNTGESILYLTATDQWKKLPKTGEETIAVLIDALNVLDADYRANIVNSLYKIKEPVLTERLILALKNRNRHVRRGAADTLDKTGWKPLNNKESALYFMAKEEWEKLSGIGKDAGDVLIDVLSFDDSTAREIAVEALGKIGDSRAVEPVIETMDDRKRIIREKAMDAFEKLRQRILTEDFDFVCENCLLRYREHEAAVKTALIAVDTVTFMACPRCRSDSYFYVAIKKIVLALDRNLKEPVVHEGDTLTVNWFKRTDSADRGCQIDYDEIRIKDADDYEIEKLIMKLKNDMNNQRRARLPDIPIYLSSGLRLSQTQKNLLKDGFNTKIIRDG